MDLRCDDVRALAARSLSEALAPRDSESLGRHLAACAECRRAARADRAVWDLAGRLPLPVPDPAGEAALLHAAAAPMHRGTRPAARLAVAAAALLALSATLWLADPTPPPGPNPVSEPVAVASGSGPKTALELPVVNVGGGSIERASTLFEQGVERDWVVAVHAAADGRIEIAEAWNRGQPVAAAQLPRADGLAAPIPAGGYALLFHTHAEVTPSCSCRGCGGHSCRCGKCSVGKSAWDVVAFHRPELLELWIARLQQGRVGPGRCRVCHQLVGAAELEFHRRSCGGSVDAAGDAAIPPGELLEVVEPERGIARTAEHLKLDGPARAAFEEAALRAVERYARFQKRLESGATAAAAERVRLSPEYAAARIVLAAAGGPVAASAPAWTALLGRTELGALVREAREREQAMAELEEWLLEDPIEGRRAAEPRAWVETLLGASSRLPDPARVGDDDLDSLVAGFASALERP